MRISPTTLARASSIAWVTLRVASYPTMFPPWFQSAKAAARELASEPATSTGSPFPSNTMVRPTRSAAGGNGGMTSFKGARSVRFARAVCWPWISCSNAAWALRIFCSNAACAAAVACASAAASSAAWTAPPTPKSMASSPSWRTNRDCSKFSSMFSGRNGAPSWKLFATTSAGVLRKMRISAPTAGAGVIWTVCDVTNTVPTGLPSTVTNTSAGRWYGKLKPNCVVLPSPTHSANVGTD